MAKSILELQARVAILDKALATLFDAIPRAKRAGLIQEMTLVEMIGKNGLTACRAAEMAVEGLEASEGADPKLIASIRQFLQAMDW